MSAPCQSVYQLTITLAMLHQVIQIAMGWFNGHMHHFIHQRTFYGIADPDFGLDETEDEKKYRLNQLLKKEKDSLLYEYDFGDSWRHIVTLEKILPPSEKLQLPVCLDAFGACPPEDVGGIPGFYDFLEAMADPKHPEHESYRECLGEEYDPQHCDLKAINARLAKLGGKKGGKR